MNSMPAGINRRVLVIDDNAAIHDDFRKILSPRSAAALDATEAALFGNSRPAIEQIQFEVDSAYQGPEGVRLVKRNLESGQPYAMAFVDVRMPPGWDGVETTQKIWELDPNLQVVLCTAYSDYSWGEMFKKLGQRDGLLILKKPFDAVEALQLASALTEKWRLHQGAKGQMKQLESLVRKRTSLLEKTNAKLTLALANVQTLSGLIPICAGCKKVRDDRGYWDQVENYIARHSDAKFTHGICPECSRKYYPGIEYPKQPTK